LKQHDRFSFLKAHINEFVFVQRNKQYGAFDLRNRYYIHLFHSLISVLCLSLISTYVLKKSLQNTTDTLLSNIDLKSDRYSATEVKIDLERPPKFENTASAPQAIQNTVDQPSQVPDKNKEYTSEEIKQVESVDPLINTSQTQNAEPVQSSTVGSLSTTEGITGGKGNSVSSDTVGEMAYSNEVYLKADENAYPKGGFESFHQLMQEKIQYPSFAYTNQVNGVVYFQAVVNTNGTLSDIKIIKHIEKTVDEAALAVLQQSPQWVPARIKGRIVRQKVLIPIYIKPKV
jgi:outer membrane biosynthesis protein TonB